MQVEVWVDPRCPWSWTTSRWLVEGVSPERDITIEWNAMSLFLVKGVDETSPVFEKLWFTHRLLRVMQAIKEAEGSASAGAAYFEFATRIWHDRDWSFDPSDALRAAGVDPDFASAFSEDSWDAAIQKSMDRAYDLIGYGIGNTPIVGVAADDQELRALYGPVLVGQPDQNRSPALWDAVVELTTNEAFAGLNRAMPDLPDFGDRPQ